MKANLKIRIFAVVSLTFCLFSQNAAAQQTAARESMDAAIEQSNGQYSEMDMPFWSLGMQQKAWNKPMEHLGEGQSKPGYSRYYWTPDLVLPLRIREGMHTLINFPSWELIENVFLGNESAFGAQKVAQNALMVFAASVDLVGMDTNMIVFGRSGNRYVFYLRSETFNTDRITNSVVDIVINDAKFVPDDSGTTPFASGAVATGAAAGVMNVSAGAGGMFGGAMRSGKKNTTKNGTEDWLADIEVDPEKLRFDIDVFIPNPADMEIAPERVWRDEIFTYIDFGPKALTMTERPIVNLLSQGSEVPIGFRTRGPNGRLMVVEGIGDLVLRNGKRILCLKIRKDPTYGTDWVEYEKSVQPQWAPGPMITTPGYNNPAAGGAKTMTALNGAAAMGGAGMSNMMNPMMNAAQIAQFSAQQGRDASRAFRYRSTPAETIAIELGSGAEIAPLEQKWDVISRKNKDLLGAFEPYYSVDAVAEGESRDLFRLRIGPVGSIEAGDKLCNQLGRRGVTCIVVRTQ